MNIEFSRSPRHQDIDFLTQRINEASPNHEPAYCFAFFIRDGNGEIIAGCNGSVVFGSIYTDQLWVHPDYRKRGLGQKLMNAVHAYGQEHGCHMATVSTMDFQNAQSFYERLGYGIDFKRTGHSNNATCIYLKKTL